MTRQVIRTAQRLQGLPPALGFTVATQAEHRKSLAGLFPYLHPQRDVRQPSSVETRWFLYAALAQAERIRGSSHGGFNSERRYHRQTSGVGAASLSSRASGCESSGCSGSFIPVSEPLIFLIFLPFRFTGAAFLYPGGKRYPAPPWKDRWHGIAPGDTMLTDALSLSTRQKDFV